MQRQWKIAVKGAFCRTSPSVTQLKEQVLQSTDQLLVFSLFSWPSSIHIQEADGHPILLGSMLSIVKLSRTSAECLLPILQTLCAIICSSQFLAHKVSQINIVSFIQLSLLLIVIGFI